MKYIMRKAFCILALAGLISLTTPARSQVLETLHPEIAVGYSPQLSNPVGGETFWMHGGSIEAAVHLPYRLSVVARLAGSRAANINGAGVDLTLITTTFGPRYTWEPVPSKVALFGETLIGVSHGSDSFFPSSSGVRSSENSFALQIGGGVDIRVSKHFAVRPFQADWLRTQFGNRTTGVQNNLQIGTGIVFRL